MHIEYDLKYTEWVIPFLKNYEINLIFSHKSFFVIDRSENPELAVIFANANLLKYYIDFLVE